MPDVFGNPDGMATGGAGNLPLPPPQAQAPQIDGQSGAAPNPLEGLLKLIQTQQQVVLPQQLPPNHVQGGDLSGNFVNPSTAGGPKHNARVTLAQSIGDAAAQAINRHEDKEARDLGYQIARVENLYNTLNDPNATQQQKDIATQELNEIPKAEWKKIQKATGIQVFSQEDKRTGIEKKAMGIAQQSSAQGAGQNNGGGAQRPPMSESLGLPQGMQLNPIAQQFQRKLLTQQGLTPQAQSVMALTKAGVISNAAQQTDMAIATMQNETKMDEIIAKVGIEQSKQMLAKEIAQSKVLTEDKKMELSSAITDAKNATALKVASTHAGAMIKSAQIRADASKSIAKGKDVVNQRVKNITAQRQILDSQSKNLATQINEEQRIVTSAKSSKNEKTIAANKLDLLETQQKELNQQLDVLGTQLSGAEKQSDALDGLTEGTTFEDIWGDASTSDQQ